MKARGLVANDLPNRWWITEEGISAYIEARGKEDMNKEELVEYVKEVQAAIRGPLLDPDAEGDSDGLGHSCPDCDCETLREELDWALGAIYQIDHIALEHFVLNDGRGYASHEEREGILARRDFALQFIAREDDEDEDDEDDCDD